MDNNYRSGYVYVQNKYAGILSETENGYTFQYDNKYLTENNALPVSLTLPLQYNAFHSPYLFPFFDGLIPEGWLLNIVSRNWKISQNDRFGILLVACKDCIGDVSIRSEVTL